MELKNFMTGVVLVAVVALAFSGLIANAAFRYGVTYDDTFLNDTLGNTTEWMDLEADMSDTIGQDSGIEDDDPDKVGKFLAKGIQTGRFATKSFTIFTSFISESSKKLSVPDYIQDGLVVIALTGIILGGLLALFTGRVKP